MHRSPTSNVELSDQWLAATLEEYKSLRVEIIDAIQAGRQIMQVGITGLSVLVGLGLQRISPFLAVLLLMVLVPVLAVFITAGALGEFFEQSGQVHISHIGRRLSIALSLDLNLGIFPLRNGSGGFGVTLNM